MKQKLFTELETQMLKLINYFLMQREVFLQCTHCSALVILSSLVLF